MPLSGQLSVWLYTVYSLCVATPRLDCTQFHFQFQFWSQQHSRAQSP